ncbi:MAG TPA: ion transporter [Candidatus Acidoferrum sp.]|nr:ion transporter [Candidatus Acidoferrum sp.]
MKPDVAQNKLTGFQLVMLVLCVYVLAALFADTVFKLSPPIVSLLQKIDTLICFVFLGDFFYQLYRAERKLAFLKWGWIDFISSIPMLSLFRWGRVVRVIRIIRILRGARSVKYILRVVFRNKARGIFGTVLLVTASLLVFACIAILNVETAPESNIKTAGDALWWAMSTVTTGGNADKFPVTAAGRIIGVMLMTTGVGFFGTLTAYIASLFLNVDKTGRTTEAELVTELKLMRERLESIEARLPHPAGPRPPHSGKPPAA